MPRVIVASMAVMAALTGGCFTSNSPKDDVAFAHVSTLQGFSGSYQNRGVTGDASTWYLSKFIWPDADINHAQLDAIRVQAESENTLNVAGVTDGNVVIESSFVEGRHFEFRDGQMHFKKEGGIAPLGEGEPFLGVYYGTTVIGLDKRGDGRLQEDGAIAGAAFLVVPVIAGSRESVRFRRVDREAN